MKKIIFVACMLIALGVSSTSFGQWSPPAKNAAIGAGVGAIAGAVIDKNHRGRGAIIGGVVGGGAGYLYGKHRSRVKARQAAALQAARRSSRVHTVREVIVYKPAPAAPVYRGYNPSQVNMANAAFVANTDVSTDQMYTNNGSPIRTKSW